MGEGPLLELFMIDLQFITCIFKLDEKLLRRVVVRVDCSELIQILPPGKRSSDDTSHVVIPPTSVFGAHLIDALLQGPQLIHREVGALDEFEQFGDPVFTCCCCCCSWVDETAGCVCASDEGTRTWTGTGT